MRTSILLITLIFSAMSQAEVLNFKCLYQQPKHFDQYVDVTLDLKKNIVHDVRTYQAFQINEPDGHILIQKKDKYSQFTVKTDKKNLVLNSDYSSMEINRERLNYKFKWGDINWKGSCKLTKRDSINAF